MARVTLLILLVCVNYCQVLCVAFARSNQASVYKLGAGLPKSQSIDLSYNECTQNGSCKIVKKVVQTPPVKWNIRIEAPHLRRRKRRLFGPDNRQRIWPRYTKKFPFSSAVAIRSNITRCSGVAVRRNVFLTAAHCIRPASGEPVSNIEVGVLNDKNILEWAAVNVTRIHVNWEGRTDYRRFRYNYAILQTTSELDVQGMKVALIGGNGRSRDILRRVRPFMFLSAFDDPDDQSILRFRSCRMKRVTVHMIYNKCDTVAETAGAGVFVNVRNKKHPRGERKVIAIDTGDLQTGSQLEKSFSKALRISRRRFAQICYWITQDYGQCHGTEV